jgi:hypothetical protein
MAAGETQAPNPTQNSASNLNTRSKARSSTSASSSVTAENLERVSSIHSAEEGRKYLEKDVLHFRRTLHAKFPKQDSLPRLTSPSRHKVGDSRRNKGGSLHPGRNGLERGPRNINRAPFHPSNSPFPWCSQPGSKPSGRCRKNL